MLKKNTKALNIFSVNKSHRNPYFNMVEKNKLGFYETVKSLVKTTLTNRQSAPLVYDMNASLYWYKRIFFDKNYKSATTPYSLIYRMKNICFDLDDQIDFDFMEYLIKNNKVDNII